MDRKTEPAASWDLAAGVFRESLIQQIQPTTPSKFGSRKKTLGITVIDCLLARALAYCAFGIDYRPTIELARRFAAAAERRQNGQSY